MTSNCVTGVGVEIIKTDQSVKRTAIIEQLEFLADLLVAVHRWNVNVVDGQRIEIDRRKTLVLAPRADRTQCEAVAQIDFGGHGEAVSLDVLLRPVQPGAGIEHVVQHRRARYAARDQAVAVARIGFVAGVIAGDADKDRFAVPAQFDTGAAGIDILVIILDAQIEIVAEPARATAARTSRRRAAGR